MSEEKYWVAGPAGTGGGNYLSADDDWARSNPSLSGEHSYLSTACLHGEHDYCKSPVGATGNTKRPAECKFCSAPCRCTCHRP